MPGFTVTRGLGGSASSMISMGFASTVKKILKGGRRFVEKSVIDLGETLKISVNLISMNGKEFSKPIFNKVSKVFKTSRITLSVFPKTLTVRKSRKIKVTASLRKEE